ncbi:hypothetical protein ANANG_G00260750 [Anguilla anguilla]|uniref:PDZ domain-containing protein n=1 Tax=Anguilla anguilla TaxID=7936 RepID=A0A9D3LP80_ANGAN|nr:hypothetical protein ANANG_G00260750 [Anguilla anguilla]
MTSKRNLFVRLVPCRCLRGEEETVTSLDYSHCSLEQVPKDIFSHEKTLEELFLDANQIEDLPKQLFNCQLLYRLSMPDNDITVLPAAIANLINLRELDVSKNSIQEFPENIKNCKVLAIVEASVNPISKLPEGFTQLLSLTQLYLNDAFLEFLPANFGRLTKLQILELRENQLKNLPKSMHKLTQLERLDLGSNEFAEVPEVLEQLTGIKELWMDGNRLTFLPGMMGTLKQLSYLDVSKNNLEMVDEQISGCENLQDLLLSNNALTQLPGSIGSLKKLTALKVDENQLMYLPDSVGGLTNLDELDCSFNEIEALPSSIGQCVNVRTFAADHNFLTQLPAEMGNWKSATVLFLHSNKLETLPEEMGDMSKLKVINLSDNKLKNLPFSFTKLSQLTAMWLSENQSKPLIPLQKEEDPETHKTVLTNYMFPQQTRTDDYIPNSDNESFNPSLWEEQRKQRAQVAFECDEDKDEREAPPREGNLKRYPTPYPEDLKNMVKTAQSVAHRLKEDESGDEPGRERVHVGVRNVGVKVIENACSNGRALELASSEPVDSLANSLGNSLGNSLANSLANSELDPSDTHIVPLKASDSPRAPLHREDTLEDSEDLSFEEEEEMKIAEMRPPLIEISINQPKVVALSKDKKDDGKDADSLLDETVANSNQNNSNCSSPSRMSDSVSLTTDSSQDASLCTPERETKMLLETANRREDENLNELQESAPLLQNGTGRTRPCRPCCGAGGTTRRARADRRRLPAINMNVAEPDNAPRPGGVAEDASALNNNYWRPAAPSWRTGTGCPGQGQSIVRSKSASLLSEQPLQVYPGSSASSSDLLSASKPPRYESRAAGPQYNVQYASSTMPKDGLWTQRTPVPPEQYLPPQHSLANTNYSNRNNAPPYPLQPQRGPPRTACWPRAPARLPPAAGQRLVRRVRVRHPGKRPNVRVRSEHCLLDAPGGGRVPVDWRDQVMRHIEAKKMEKNVLSRSYNPYYAAASGSRYGSCRDVHASHGSLAFSAGDGRPHGAHYLCDEVFGPPGPQGYPMDSLRKVPLSNGQMCPVSRGPAPMARHPSREQLIDYLMLKVSQQPQGPPRPPHEVLQEVRVKIEKNPELGFSISGGLGGRGNPFRPEDNGIFVTRVQPEGPASKLLQPGDKILKANGHNFVNIDHGYAVSLLKMFPSTVDLVIVREVSA